MVSITLLFGFLTILFLFGYVVSSRLLRVTNPYAVAGMTWFFGEAFYSTLINAAGYFIPIYTAFWLSLGAIIILTLLCFRCTQSQKLLSPPYWINVSIWAIALFAAIVFLRVTPSDPLSLIHYPVPATILEGNFPIRDPFNPWTGYGYHYAPMLLAAAVSAITGVSLALSYAIQSFLHAGTIVFFAVALGYVLLRSWKGALFVAVFAIAGIGFHWWYAFPFVRDLYAAYIVGVPLQAEHETPFRLMTYMFGSARIQPLIATVIHRAIGMGVASMMASLFAVHMIIDVAKSRRDQLLWGGVLLVCSSVLALSLETTFVVLMLGILFAGIFYSVTSYSRQTALRMCGLVLICCAFAAIQGGVITSTLELSGDTRPSAFVWNPDGIYHFSADEGVAFWDLRFLRDVGFTLLLLPFAIALAWKKRKEMWMPLFLSGLGVMHMVVPFVIDFPGRPHNLDRLFHVGVGLSAMVVAWWLWITCIQSSSTGRRAFVFVVSIATLLSTSMNLSVRLFYPDFERGRNTFTPSMPARDTQDMALYAWVRENTEPQDRFFYTQLSEHLNPVHDPEFSIFVAYTGRFLVKRGFSTDAEVGRDSTILSVEKTCNIAALRALEIDYVVVKLGEQRNWFSTHCTATAFTSVYSEDGIVVYVFSG